jgi:type IV secretory pathway TrbD component
MSNLRRSPFHRVLHRPNLFLGGERNLVMSTLVICGGFAISSQSWWAAGIAAVVWFVTIGCFRQMAKIDPYLSNIYLRHIKYQSYYAPRSRPARIDTGVIK